MIHRRGPWRSFEAVEFATLDWVDWFNNRRLLEPIGNIPPAEAEERYYAMLDEQGWPRDSNQTASDKPGAVHSPLFGLVSQKSIPSTPPRPPPPRRRVRVTRVPEGSAVQRPK